MRTMQTGEERLKNIIICDKNENTFNIDNVMKNELYYLLKNYFELSASDITINLNVNNLGNYELNIGVIARDIKIAHSF